MLMGEGGGHSGACEWAWSSHCIMGIMELKWGHQLACGPYTPVRDEE